MSLDVRETSWILRCRICAITVPHIDDIGQLKGDKGARDSGCVAIKRIHGYWSFQCSWKVSDFQRQLSRVQAD